MSDDAPQGPPVDTSETFGDREVQARISAAREAREAVPVAVTAPYHLAPSSGTGAIRDAVAHAETLEPLPGDGGPGDGGPGDEGPDHGGPPDGGPPGDGGGPAPAPVPCPIVALGETRDGSLYFLARDGQLRFFHWKEIGNRAGIASLFSGRMKWLRQEFAAVDKDGKKTGGWSHDMARDGLMRMCSDAGLFDPSERIRGPGAWLDDDGNLVVHGGDRVFVPDAGRAPLFVAGDRTADALAGGPPGWVKAGVVHGDIIYPSGPPETRPAEAAASVEDARALLELLDEWHWESPQQAGRLLLGFIGQGYICGALDWRTQMWITGDMSAGKTLLARLIKGLMGTLLIKSADSTEASIRQLLKADESARVISIDEAEPEPGSRRIKDLVRMCRLASNAADTHRGSVAGRATRFRLNCALLFSSILYPRLMPQEASRIVVMELDDLASASQDDRERVRADVAALSKLGPGLYARMVTGWGRLQTNLDVYRVAMGHMKATIRTADQFGTLLACAETLLSDEAATPESAAAVLHDLVIGDFAKGRESNHELCLMHLWTARTEMREGGRVLSVGEIVDYAIATQVAGGGTTLKALGLKLVSLVRVADGEPLRFRDWQVADGPAPVGICISDYGAALEAFYGGSPWEQGRWPQALVRFKGAVKTANAVAFVGKLRQRAVFVPYRCFDFEAEE